MLVPGASGAGDEQTFSRHPAEGGPGTVIAVTGSGCGGQGIEAYVSLSGREGQRFDTSATFPVGADGTFGGELVVPPRAPSGAYRLGGFCTYSDVAWGSFEDTFQVPAPGGDGSLPTFSRSPDHGPPGTVIAMSGTGCILGDAPAEARFHFSGPGHNGPAPSLVARSDGSWETEYAVPSDATPGHYGLYFRCGRGPQDYGWTRQDFQVDPRAS